MSSLDYGIIVTSRYHDWMLCLLYYLNTRTCYTFFMVRESSSISSLDYMQNVGLTPWRLRDWISTTILYSQELAINRIFTVRESSTNLRELLLLDFLLLPRYENFGTQIDYTFIYVDLQLRSFAIGFLNFMFSSVQGLAIQSSWYANHQGTSTILSRYSFARSSLLFLLDTRTYC